MDVVRLSSSDLTLRAATRLKVRVRGKKSVVRGRGRRAEVVTWRGERW